MNSNSLLAFVAAGFSAGLALLVSLRRRSSIARWCFVAGMAIVALESVLAGLSQLATTSQGVHHWQVLAFTAKSFLPSVWFCFSLTYSRGSYREFLRRSRLLLLLLFLVPVALSLSSQGNLLSVNAIGDPVHAWWISLNGLSKTLNAVLLIGSLLVLLNLERTFRSAVGTMQWKIKFMVLGLGILFGARIYTQSQALLFSGQTLNLTAVETGGVLIGCSLIAIAYFRTGFSEIDVYPSRAVLHTSVVVLLVGGYLLVVGVLAQVAAQTGKGEGFQLEAFVILLALAGLGVLLLSARLRQKLQRFVSRNFKRPQHDFRQVWTRFTQSVYTALDQPALCTSVARLISETFNVLSVTIWIFNEEEEELCFASSTSQSVEERNGANSSFSAAAVDALRRNSRSFDLEKAQSDWAETLKEISANQFRTGGNRICIPFVAGDRFLGVAILADRVSGSPYTLEEFDLLNCIGEQVAASLLNVRLTDEVVRANELHAFQTISAFFVHDLKNAASTLSLMLQNLPIHFDDASFRQDTLRGIAKTVDRINQLVGGLTVVRRKLELTPVDIDFRRLVEESMQELRSDNALQWVTKFDSVPTIVADRMYLQSVVTNLLLNARDAVSDGGQITIETIQRGRWATLKVSDTGCGMSPSFVRDSLFRPFQTSKKNGLGIGMYQSKMIVEAHRGKIQVESALGSGTTFEVMLPLKDQTNET